MIINQKQSVVFDIGSTEFRAGQISNNLPSNCFPTVIGYEKQQSLICQQQSKQRYIGNQAMKKKEILTMNYPIQKKICQNWDQFEMLIFHAYYEELKILAEEQPILITNFENTTQKDREKIIQYMFETFNVPGFYLCNQGLLSLYSYGKMTGMVIDIGEQITSMIPIIDGYQLQQNISIIPYGGSLLNSYLNTLLKSQEQISYKLFQFINELEFIKQYQNDNINIYEQIYRNNNIQLPDEQIINLNKLNKEYQDILFNPFKIDIQEKGIHQYINQQILNYDLDIQNQLVQNILLCGGTANSLQICNKIQYELNYLLQKNVTVNGIQQQRQFSSWIGGSILANISTFQNLWITMEEYNETGPQIILNKCF